MYIGYILRLALSPFYRLGSNDPAINPMVRHKVIRIDLGGDRRGKHARTGCISLIGQGALALQNSPHGWRKRAFPSLPSSAPSLTHPHVFSFYLFSHLTHTLRPCVYQTMGQLLDIAACGVWSLRVAPKIRHSGCLCTLQNASRTPCWQIRYPVPRLPRCYE